MSPPFLGLRTAKYAVPDIAKGKAWYAAALRPAWLAAAALFLAPLAGCSDDPIGLEPRDIPRRTVAAGTNHSCALDEDGRAWCWGSNRMGQLGTTEVELNSWTPVEVASGRAYVSIAAATTNNLYAPFDSCALTGDGEAYCWGTNLEHFISSTSEGVCSGTLGDASYSYPCVRIPTRVAPSLRFVQLSVGSGFACGVTGGGEAWCWGMGDRGQLGDGGSSSSAEPVRVAGSHRFAMVTAGDRHACGLDSAGIAWCWGDDTSGQLGHGLAGTVGMEPEPVSWGKKLTYIDAGDIHTCAIDSDRHGVCWGASASGRLGNIPTPLDPPYGPIEVRGGVRYATISAGLATACGITTTGAVLCWGALSNGTSQVDPFPVGGPSMTEVSAGYLHGCGRSASLGVVCWGDNTFPGPGQLGLGETVEHTDVPLPVSF